jgi:HK97 family phage portal protein
LRLTPFAFPESEPGAAANRVRVRNQAGDGGVMITDLTDSEATAYLRGEGMTSSGAVVNVAQALKVATAWRCLHLIAGVCGNTPIDVIRRAGENVREPAVGHPVRQLLTVRPNGWQTPSEFRKMLTAHAVMKGNGTALKVTSRGRVSDLWPMDPDRVSIFQAADMSIGYGYTRRDGRTIPLTQADVLHLRGLTWDGIAGVGVLRHAREAMGFALQAEHAGARLFRQGFIGNQIFSKPGLLSDEAFARLRMQLSEEKAGADNAHKALILEEDLKHDGELMSNEDLQFLGLREFQRSDIAAFFGVPPHMVGIVDKTTSWGSGIEQQSTGFVQYTADDWFVMWEQACARDLLDPVRDADLFVRINRNALLRGDTNARWAAYVRGRQWGVFSADEIRAMEDMNPRPDGRGGEYAEPPNAAGDSGAPDPNAPPSDNKGKPPQ